MELEKFIRNIRKGYKIVFDSVSRMSRNAETYMHTLQDKNIILSLHCGDEATD